MPLKVNFKKKKNLVSKNFLKYKYFKYKKLGFCAYSPKKIGKYRSHRKVSYKFISKGYGNLTKSHIQMALMILRQKVQRRIKARIFFKPFIPITKKPSQSRMGKGKGKIYKWFYYVKPGKLLFELPSFLKLLAVKKAFLSINKKLPVKGQLCRFFKF